MGWSVDVVRDDIDDLFTNQGKKYRISHVGAEIPMVMIQYESEIPLQVKKVIVGLFPEAVYINFVPNSTFPMGSSISPTDAGTKLAETQ